MFDAERTQILIAFGDIGVTTTGEVATVNVGSGQRIADPFLHIKIGSQDFLLFLFWHFGKSLSRGVRHCAADPQKTLIGLRRVDEYAHLSFQRLSEVFEGQGVGS